MEENETHLNVNKQNPYTLCGDNGFHAITHTHKCIHTHAHTYTHRRNI